MAGRAALSEEFAADLRVAASGGPRPGANLLFYAIVLFFGAALFWSARATVDEVTVGQGRAIPTSQIQVVQNLEGGILLAILVAEGDIVEPGQILLRDDDTGFAATYRENRARYLSLLAVIARLEADAAGRAPTWPDALAEEPELRAAELALFEARRRELDSSIAVLQRQEEQRRQELLELDHRISGLDGSLTLAREELAIMAPMV